MRRKVILFVLLSLLGLLLAACADEGDPGDAVEAYLRAKVEADADELVSLSCRAWEAQAGQEAASFQSVSAELQDMSCERRGEDGDYTLVTCTGLIVAEYRGEERELPLSDTTYRTIEEDGEWRVCGEQ